MKKSKLNAVLASVLSLGVVCSGCSVYAARAEEPTIPVEPLAPVGLYSEENNAETIKEEFEEYKTNREVLVRKIESSKEKVDDKELKELSSYLKFLLYDVLKELDLLSRHWSPEINELFCGCSWECVPADVRNFISMAKSEDTCGFLENYLDGLCKLVEFLPEEFKSEKTLFPILREIFYEITKKENPTTPLQSLTPGGLHFKKSKAKRIKEEFNKYKANREVLVRKIESSKEKVDDEELKGLASYFDDILYEVLKGLNSLSQHWSPEINELFCGCSWECIPQINCEFVSMAKDENTCGLLEEILNNICDVVDILPEEFESEKTLFSILREIFYEVGKITEIFVENNKLI